MAPSSVLSFPSSANGSYKFQSAGLNFLAQHDPATDETTFDHLTQDFGLVKSSWSEFHEHFLELKKSAGENTRYKVLYLGRHGQGYHNLCIETYGQEAFDTRWGLINTDGKTIWGPDAELTELGIQQAKANHTAWKKQISKGIPLPVSFYVSPFTRAIDTMIYTWDGILLSPPPLVVDDLRETIGVEPCNRRRSRTHIATRFSKIVKIEPSFTEEDETWRSDYKELPHEHDIRTTRFLTRLFDSDWDNSTPDDYISVTSHTGTIESFLRVINHRPFPIATGGMIPVIVRVDKI